MRVQNFTYFTMYLSLPLYVYDSFLYTLFNKEDKLVITPIPFFPQHQKGKWILRLLGSFNRSKIADFETTQFMDGP